MRFAATHITTSLSRSPNTSDFAIYIRKKTHFKFPKQSNSTFPVPTYYLVVCRYSPSLNQTVALAPALSFRPNNTDRPSHFAAAAAGIIRYEGRRAGSPTIAIRRVILLVHIFLDLIPASLYYYGSRGLNVSAPRGTSKITCL